MKPPELEPTARIFSAQPPGGLPGARGLAGGQWWGGPGRPWKSRKVPGGRLGKRVRWFASTHPQKSIQPRVQRLGLRAPLRVGRAHGATGAGAARRGVRALGSRLEGLMLPELTPSAGHTQCPRAGQVQGRGSHAFSICLLALILVTVSYLPDAWRSHRPVNSQRCAFCPGPTPKFVHQGFRFEWQGPFCRDFRYFPLFGREMFLCLAGISFWFMGFPFV